MAAKIINIDLTEHEYLPIKVQVESLPYIPNERKFIVKSSIVQYLIAIANLHGITIGADFKTVSLVYFRFEQDMRKETTRYIIKATLSVSTEEVDLSDA